MWLSRYELDTAEWLHFHFSLSCIGEGNGNPLQCSCLENPRDRGAWWAAVHGVAQSQTRLKQLSSSSSKHIQHRTGQAGVTLASGVVGSRLLSLPFSHSWPSLCLFDFRLRQSSCIQWPPETLALVISHERNSELKPVSVLTLSDEVLQLIPIGWLESQAEQKSNLSPARCNVQASITGIFLQPWSPISARGRD